METKERICDFMAAINDVEIRIVAGLHRVIKLTPEEQKESQISGGMERA